MAVFEAGVVALTPDVNGTTLLERTGIELADLYVAILPQDSYLYKAGLRPGDKILRLDDEPVPAWSTFRERVLAAPDRAHRIDFRSARDGRVRSGSFQHASRRLHRRARSDVRALRSSDDSTGRPSLPRSASPIRRRSATRSKRP